MKKQLLIYISLLIMVLNQACNDELDDELFEKAVLFTKNGWIEQEIYPDETGIVEIPVIVSVNGTSGNTKNVEVEIGLDSDTLDNYNFEKYRNQTALYYQQPADSALTIAQDVITIPRGELNATTTVSVNINKLSDKYADYVIPLAITGTSDYKIAEADYGKALLHIVLENSFSGNYSGETAVYKTNEDGSNDTGNKITVSVKSLYALTEQKCYFYAGQFDRTNVDRDKFIVDISIDGNGDVSLSSPNPELELNMEEASVEINSTEYTNDSRYNIVTTTLYLKYTFVDLTSSDKNVLRAEGTVSMNQNVLKEQE